MFQHNPVLSRLAATVFDVAMLGCGLYAFSAEPVSDVSLGRFQEAARSAYGFRTSLKLEAFDFIEQLEEHIRQERWLPFYRLVDDDLDQYRNQLFFSRDDIWLSTGEYCEQLFRQLPHDGKQQIRLYIDGRAKQAIEAIQNTTDPKTLLDIRRDYYLSSYGDTISDLVGDGLFQAGRYRDAYESWRSIFDDHPGTTIPEVRLLVKQAIALRNAGDSQRFEAVRSEVESRFATSNVRLAGQIHSAVTFLSELRRTADSSVPSLLSITHESSTVRGQVESPQKSYTFDPENRERWTWSLFLDELVGRGSTLPGFALDDQRCMVTFGQQAAICDMNSGKLDWIVALPTPASTDETYLPDREIRLRQLGLRIKSSQLPRIVPMRFENPISNSGKFFWASKPADSSEAILIAVEGTNGKMLWSSLDRLTGFRVVSVPVSFHDLVFCLVQNKNSGQLCLAALRQADGKTDWLLELGSIQSLGISFGPWQMGSMVVGENGLFIGIANAILSVDPVDRTIRWMYRFSDDVLDLQEQEFEFDLQANQFLIVGMRILGYGSPQSEDMVLHRNKIFVWHEKARRLICLDDSDKMVKWSKEDLDLRTIACATDTAIYTLLRDSLSCRDVGTGNEQWTVPVHRNFGQAVRLDDQILVPSERGTYVIGLDGKTSTLLANIPEIGTVRKILVQNDRAFLVANDHVSLLDVSTTVK